MHDNIVIIENDPACISRTLDARIQIKFPLHHLVDMLDNCFQLTLILARTNHKVVGDGTKFPNIEQHNVVSLLILG